MNVVELYSGSGTISQAFKSLGHSTFEIDNRKRKGICTPDLKADIMNVTAKDIPFNKIEVVWCSFPCQAFSHAAGDYYFKNGSPQNESARYFLKLLKSTLILINELSPVLYFIENPRGHLRYQKILLDWLCRNNGMTKELTYASYGFPTIKPTNLFTNAHDFVCRSLHPYGRGNKNPVDIFDNMTTCQRQKVPNSLALEVAMYCEQKITGTLKDLRTF